MRRHRSRVGLTISVAAITIAAEDHIEGAVKEATCLGVERIWLCQMEEVELRVQVWNRVLAWE